MSNQPKWKLVANLGDVNPLDYGGYFVYVDETGVYDPEAELLVEPSDDKYLVYRFPLERCHLIDAIDKSVGDNKYHPRLTAWFSDSLASIAESADIPDIAKLLCSENPIDLAEAYHVIGNYHGFENLDSYPLTLTRAEAEARYSK